MLNFVIAVHEFRAGGNLGTVSGRSINCHLDHLKLALGGNLAILSI